ncbi:MFS transporter [Halorubrum sp. DTA98]|uniref:MFS transporter n=1 Tax=Halorubrum sp. DTA98 TaxID=3402163 RepID=UPI003AAAEA06
MASVVERLPAFRYRDRVLALCTFAFFVTMFGRLAISPVVPRITDSFEVSNAAVGLALSGMWLAYGLAQFPSGVLADRYGERSVILVSVGGTAVTALLIAAAPAYPAFVLATVLLGGMAGLHYSVGTTFLARIYDDVGTAVGVHNTGGTVAGLLTPVAVSWVAVRYGWRPAVALGAVVGLVGVVLFALGVRPTEPRRPDQPIRERFRIGPLSELLSRPSIAFTVVLAALGEFAWQGVASFLPTLLIEHHGYSATAAGIAFGGYFVAQGIAQVVVGVASDRFGRDVVTGMCMVVGAAGIALALATPHVVAIAAAMVLVGVGMSFGAALLPRFLDHLSDAEQGAGFGLVRTVYMFVAASGSVVVGFLADVAGWTVAFGSVIGLLCTVAVALAANRLLGPGW